MFWLLAAVCASRKSNTDQTKVTTATKIIVPSAVNSDRTGLRVMFRRIKKRYFTDAPCVPNSRAFRPGRHYS
jgi:hypothetical protein